MNDLPTLKPGDILLYDQGTLVDKIIKGRTWSDVAHVEIYLGEQQTTASRPRNGVNIYPFNPKGLKYVRRPIQPFLLYPARQYAIKMTGTPYGYGDLGRFYLLKIPTKGMICSQYGDLLLRAGNVIAFAKDYAPGAVSPRDYRLTPLALTIWSNNASN